MKRYFFLLLLVTFSSAIKSQTIIIETGVSESLARHRKQTISDIRYNLSFQIPSKRTEAVKGEEILIFNWRKNDKPLQLDFRAGVEQLQSVFVNDGNEKALFENEHIIIPASMLKEGSNKLTIRFVAGDLSLNRSNDFLYTLLVPDRARTVFPCFDQPDLKASYQLQLTIPKTWQAVGNATIIDSVINENDKTLKFAPSDIFSTYLFSFVAGNFQRREQITGNQTMQFFYRETDPVKIRLSMDTIFHLHQRSVQFLENYTGLPFPFKKLDFTAIPDFQYGGMEHVGAIDYKASTLFLDSGATRDQENARSNLIAHETSHMWFGDLVTMQWFNDVWMKEVFANFMADKITRNSTGVSDYELKFLLTHYPRAYAIDRTAGANPIRQPLNNLKEAGNLYGPIIYDKAPVMMRQLERLMGEQSFQQGLREYLKKYAFGNATWPDLIAILDNLTQVDLQAWNKVWVNTPGRPLLSYSMEQRSGKISRLILQQKGEQSKGYVLPQFFEIALVYPNRVEELTVHMNAASVEIKEAIGKSKPLYILFNSSGQGYGLFPVDPAATSIEKLKDPLMRASAYINQFENMLAGRQLSPVQLFKKLLDIMGHQKEPEELTLNLLSSQLGDIFWRLLSKQTRTQLAGETERMLWSALQNETVAARKKILYRSYQNIASTKPALDSLYQIWLTQKPPQGLRLSEEEYTSLALNLAVKNYPEKELLSKQLDRITNADRKQRLVFLMPAVSQEVLVRDSFFASLKNPVTRKKEAWVADALSYLHHPNRTNTSIRYLKESLDLLEEVQQTGDIFFPAAWLNASLGNYQSKEAASIVRNFLHAHPHYNAQLKMKLLQAADQLFRAEKLVR